MSQPISIGLLAYTLIPATSASSASLAFLLWRDRKSTNIESNSYYGHIVTPKLKNDSSPLDTVARGFATKTKGLFAPLATDQLVLSQQDLMDESKKRIREKIAKRQGSTLLSHAGHLIYVTPVRFVSEMELNEKLSAYAGEAHWITANDLFNALNSNQPSVKLTITAKPLRTLQEKHSDPIELPLYLPFTVLLRSATAYNEIFDLLKPFDATLSSIAFNSSSINNDNAVQATDDTTIPTEEKSSNNEISDNNNNSDNKAELSAATHQFACFKCRKIIFTNNDIIPHEALTSNSNHTFAKKKPAASNAFALDCSSYFIDNQSTIETLGPYDSSDGKLICKKCNSRLGSYTWAGVQCSCGQWITPAFQITKSRIDQKPILHNAARPNIIKANNPPTAAAINPSVQDAASENF
jgi:hypothetical protein